ncbi:DNA repair protein RecO [Desulfurobacterium indicum]|uniref:DNA repair protein RecO n=1 Tax=Desulfurobacterium indicum TaxID=1914305 RepID=A0A1R1MMY3_9BACT|nr:DNA repair protein RecO [Desulfurobacterium indicum]OMH41181.1 DNA repair protein RecO [Desulfurobacterium indicum]
METPGIVLKKEKLSERLFHLSLYTERMGKINALIRLELKDFPLSVEPFSLSIFNLKITGERTEIMKVKLLKHNVPKDIRKFKYLSLIAKYVDSFTGSAPEKKIFELTRFYMMNVKDRFLLAATMFIIKLAFFEGLFPNLTRCAICGSSKNISGFSLEEGSIVCNKCSRGNLIPWNETLSKETIYLLKNSFFSIKFCRINSLKRIRNLFEKHLSYRIGTENVI